MNAVPSPPSAGPRAVTTPTSRARMGQIIALIVFVVLMLVVVRACSGHENRYERLARDLTAAVQNNDYAAVTKLENSETAAEMGRGRLGSAADRLAPLGKIRNVHETTAANAAPRVHDFDITFEHGAVHETLQLDPDGKVFHFGYRLRKT